MFGRGRWYSGGRGTPGRGGARRGTPLKGCVQVHLRPDCSHTGGWGVVVLGEGLGAWPPVRRGLLLFPLFLLCSRSLALFLLSLVR